MSILIPEAPYTARERMVKLLDATVLGMTPPLHCGACVESLADRCADCADNLAIIAKLTAGIEAVQQAKTETEALTAYDSCLLGLAGAEASS